VTTASLARCSFVVFICLLVQHTILDTIRIAGAHPDLMILLPIAGGYVAGPERGAAFGFATGLIADLLLPTTFGLSALVGCLLGYGVGTLTASMSERSSVLTLFVFSAATASGLTAYAILGAVLGEPLLVSAYLPAALVVCVPTAFLLAAPVTRVVAWALPAPTGAESGSRLKGAR